MGSVPFHYIDLRAFCYATEDEQRVKRALRTLLPDEHPIDRQESEGHYGDRILVFSTRVETADDMRYVLEQLRAGNVLVAIADEIDDRVTENTELFVQLDKQAAYNGTVALGDGITFRAKIEAYPAKRSHAIENLTSAIEELAQ